MSEVVSFKNRMIKAENDGLIYLIYTTLIMRMRKIEFFICIALLADKITDQ